METFLNDLRYGIRSLLRRPAVFAVATVSLALGIAANTTIFAAVDAYLIRALPYADADNIVQVGTSNVSRGWRRAGNSPLDVRDWRAQSRTMELGAHTGASYNMRSGERSDRVSASLVTPNVFAILGVSAARGRTLLADEEREGAPKVAVLSYAFWERQFGADPGIVGRTITLDGTTYPVVGIMPRGFAFPDNTVDLWAPLQHSTKDTRDSRSLAVIARVRPGNTFDRATAELKSIAKQLATTYPENAGNSVNVMRLREALYDSEFRRGATLSTFAVVFVLLIACANVANLLLARASARSRELALRTALGAERGRLVRQLLTESVVLALIGGALGTLLSIAGIKALVSIIPPNFFGTDRIALNGRALLFTLGVSVASGILFGILPALHATRANINNALRESGRSGMMGMRRNRLGASLVIAEVSLALVLLIAAGLLIKGTIKLQQVDLGFDPRNLMTFRVTLPANQYADSTAIIAAQEEIARRVNQVGGVAALGAASGLPMQGGTGTSYWIDGEAKPELGKERIAQYRGATPEYFTTMKIALMSGRVFTKQDRLDAPRVMLVNEEFAKRHWPKGDAVGHRIMFSTIGAWEIVGVVHDSRDFGPADDPPVMMYFSALQRAFRGMSFVVRTNGDPASLAASVRRAVSSFDATIPAYGVRTMADVIEEDQRSNKIMPRLLTVFGAIALLLAVIGVYGVMSYSVSQRTQEVGIRFALGAQRGDILHMVLRQGAFICSIGLVIGLGLASLTTRTLSGFLLGVSAFDPAIFGGVTLALAAAALVATWLPARRAMRVDPLVALRYE